MTGQTKLWYDMMGEDTKAVIRNYKRHSFKSTLTTACAGLESSPTHLDRAGSGQTEWGPSGPTPGSPCRADCSVDKALSPLSHLRAFLMVERRKEEAAEKQADAPWNISS